MESNKDNKKKRRHSINLSEKREQKKIEKNKTEKDASKFDKILENFSFINEPSIKRKNSAITKERVFIKSKININTKLSIEEQINKGFLEQRCNFKEIKDKISIMNGKLTNIDVKLININDNLSCMNNSINDIKGVMSNNNEILKNIYDFIANNNKKSYQDSKNINNKENIIGENIAFSFINKKNESSSNSNEEVKIITNIFKEEKSSKIKSKSKMKKNIKKIQIQN